MDTEFELRKVKRASGQFTWDDLNPIAQSLIQESSKVVTLWKNKWMRVGNYWILNKEVGGNMDDAIARLVTRPYRPFINWVLLPLARIFDKGTWVVWWETVPDTNIVIDIWYIGDGSGGVVLAAEHK